MATSTGTPSPVTLRLDEEGRQLLETLSKDRTASAVLRQGLQELANRLELPSAPVYPRFVDEPAIRTVIERAAAAAVAELDTLFEGERPELRGISSNFHGLLEEHLSAMLTGKEAATKGYKTVLNPLFARSDVFGVVRGPVDNKEGYGLAKLPARHGDPLVFLNSDSNQFVPIEKLDIGMLYTSAAAATEAGIAWFARTGQSPQHVPLKLCLLSWDDSSSLKLAELSS